MVADLEVPNGAPTRALLFLHGGYVFGSAETHRDLVPAYVGRRGVRALSLNYRLAPENRFPAAVKDALAGYRWLLSQGVDPTQVVFAGDSASGGLALATLVALRDQGTPLPAASVCTSPVTDQAKEGRSMVTKAALAR